MQKLFTIGIDVVIIALIAGSLFSGKPMWQDKQAARSAHAALNVSGTTK
jgi:hypothetical protein